MNENNSDKLQVIAEASRKSMEIAEEAIRSMRATLSEIQRTLEIEKQAAARKRGELFPRETEEHRAPDGMDRVLRMPELMRIFGVSTSKAIYSRANKGLLPKPCHFGQTMAVWWKSEIEQIIALVRNGAGESEVKSLVRKIEAGRNGASKC